MSKIIVVGSGASGVHFSLSVLNKGHEVVMLDVGNRKPDIINPDDSINALKRNLDDPVDYFLGKDFEAFISPDHDKEYYGFPPNKNYVFSKPPQFKSAAEGFEPLYSFAQGGLAEVWTGGVYPLNDDELSDFPFSSNDLLPYYEEVAHRIGISGVRDDLAGFYPYHKNIQPPLDLDRNSRLLLSKYTNKKNYLNGQLRFHMGRSRIATLSRDLGKRKACDYTGRCLWGCPSGSLYTPSLTLEACRKFDNFTYIPKRYVRHFNYDAGGRITSVVAESTDERDTLEYALDHLVMAAGTLSSSKIFLESIYKKTGKIAKLTGLMDNRQVLIPFLNPRMVGAAGSAEGYQYHQVALCLQSDDPRHAVHGQITTLKSALIHPIIQNMPIDTKTALFVFRHLHPALGLININFHDCRRDQNYVSLMVDSSKTESALAIKYAPPLNEGTYMARIIKAVKKAFLRLGCIIPPGMTHVRPMGASVHYCGTIPMSDNRAPFTTSKSCRSQDFDNLFFVDGTTFPFLPAKNLTFTLMANAIRVAENAF